LDKWLIVFIKYLHFIFRTLYENHVCNIKLNKYIELNTKEETIVKKRDFFLIGKGITYAQKSKAGLKLLFFKCPSGNDKVSVKYDEGLEEWFQSGDSLSKF